MKEKRLVFTGDSITDCDRLWDARTERLGFGYVRMIYDELREKGSGEQKVQEEGCGTVPGFRIYNRGHDGFTAFQMKHRWEEDCISLKPDVVTILVGINDLYMHIGGAGGYGPEGYRLHLEEMIKRVRKDTDSDLILMEPFVFPKPLAYAAWEEPLSAFRRELRLLAGKYQTGFVPLGKLFREAQKRYSLDELTTDGIHLTETGHRLLAAAWLACYGER